MSKPLTFKALAKRLEKETVVLLNLPVDTNIEAFKKRLSQAKHRLSIEGKLSFTLSPDVSEDGLELSIVLTRSIKGTIAVGATIIDTGV